MSCRQNFSVECEAALNDQINLELYAFHVYLELYSYFSQDIIALHNVAKYFKKSSDEEKEHATKLIDYVIQRGSKYVSSNISHMESHIKDLHSAFAKALNLEKKVNQSLLDLHALAEKLGDKHLCDYIEEEFLDEQVKAQKELADHITNILRCGPGLGEFIFDKNL